VFAAKEGEIPGVDIPFRKVNPKYPANQDVLGEVRVLRDRVKRDRNYDCSEIAEDLLKAAKGKGQIIEVLPSGERKDLTLYEMGERQDGFDYHQVYTDGQYVYDPRLSSETVPKGDWEIMIRSLNSEATFHSVKRR
jgi:filamentous hemagglutinin